MDGNISGLVDDLSFRGPEDDDRNPIAGSSIMTESTIDAGGFGGDLTADTDLMAVADLSITESNLGTYIGLFFGPNGEEVGGTVTLSVQTDAKVQNGVGFFVAEYTPGL